MGTRRQAREAALGYLYQTDSKVDSVTDTPIRYAQHFQVVEVFRPFFFSLVEGVLAHQVELDTEIEAVAENWKLYRMGRVDRSILRLASWEIRFCPETDLEVIINEAVELAKIYGSQDSASFVNGLLDKIAHKQRPTEVKAPFTPPE